MSENNSKSETKKATEKKSSPTKNDLTKRRKGDKVLPANTRSYIPFYPEEDIQVEDTQLVTFNGRYDENEVYTGDNKKQIKMKPIFSFKNVEAFTKALQQLDTEVFTSGFKPRLKPLYLQMIMKDQAKTVFHNIIPPTKKQVADYLSIELTKNTKEIEAFNHSDSDSDSDSSSLSKDQKAVLKKLKEEEKTILNDLLHFDGDISEELKCHDAVSDETHHYFYKMIIKQLQKKTFINSNALADQKAYMQSNICKVTQWTALENAERLRTINSRLMYFPKFDTLGAFTNLQLKEIYFNLLPDSWQGQIRVTNHNFMEDNVIFEDLIDHAIRIEQNEESLKTKEQLKKQSLKKKSNNNNNNNSNNKRSKSTSTKSKSEKFCHYCKVNNNKFFYNHNTEDCGIKKRAEGARNNNNSKKRSADMLYVSRTELAERESNLKMEIMQSLKCNKGDKNNSDSDSE